MTSPCPEQVFRFRFLIVNTVSHAYLTFVRKLISQAGTWRYVCLAKQGRMFETGAHPGSEPRAQVNIRFGEQRLEMLIEVVIEVNLTVAHSDFFITVQGFSFEPEGMPNR